VNRDRFAAKGGIFAVRNFDATQPPAGVPTNGPLSTTAAVTLPVGANVTRRERCPPERRRSGSYWCALPSVFQCLSRHILVELGGLDGFLRRCRGGRRRVRRRSRGFIARVVGATVSTPPWQPGLGGPSGTIQRFGIGGERSGSIDSGRFGSVFARVAAAAFQRRGPTGC